MAVMLVIHGRLVYPIYGMRVDMPEAAALVVMVFYGGLHAVSLLLAVATIVLTCGDETWRLHDLARTSRVRHCCTRHHWFLPLGIGPVLTLVCELFFAGWFVALGSQLIGMRARAA